MFSKWIGAVSPEEVRTAPHHDVPATVSDFPATPLTVDNMREPEWFVSGQPTPQAPPDECSLSFKGGIHTKSSKKPVDPGQALPCLGALHGGGTFHRESGAVSWDRWGAEGR